MTASIYNLPTASLPIKLESRVVVPGYIGTVTAINGELITVAIKCMEYDFERSEILRVLS